MLSLIGVGAGVGEDVGVGVIEGVGVEVIEGDGVADADAEAEGGAEPAALGDAWLLLSDDKQPAIDNKAITTSTIITNNFFFHTSPSRPKNKSNRQKKRLGSLSVVI